MKAIVINNNAKIYHKTGNRPKPTKVNISKGTKLVVVNIDNRFVTLSNDYMIKKDDIYIQASIVNRWTG